MIFLSVIKGPSKNWSIFSALIKYICLVFVWNFFFSQVPLTFPLLGMPGNKPSPLLKKRYCLEEGILGLGFNIFDTSVLEFSYTGCQPWLEVQTFFFCNNVENLINALKLFISLKKKKCRFRWVTWYWLNIKM